MKIGYILSALILSLLIVDNEHLQRFRNISCNAIIATNIMFYKPVINCLVNFLNIYSMNLIYVFIW